jgi:hypothetical protein
MVTQIFMNLSTKLLDIVIFSVKLAIPVPQNPFTSKPWVLRTPGKNRPVKVRQGKAEGTCKYHRYSWYENIGLLYEI